MKKWPLISVIVSNYNGASLGVLSECLKNFVALDYPNYELILVDNASTDKSIKVAGGIFRGNPRFKVVANPINMYSQGVNLGFMAARGDYVALFNNDIEPEKGYLQKLVSAFARYPKLAYAQGKLLWYFDHTIIDSAGESMDTYGNPVTLGYTSKDTGVFDKEEEILSSTGAACLIRKSALDEVGIYDNNFGIGYEDMDHGLRFRLRGYTNMRIPSAVCYHRRGVTDLSPEVRTKVRWHFNKNRLATMIRNYNLMLLFRTLPITLVIYLSSMIWEIVALRNVPLALTRVKAVWWVASNLNYLLKSRFQIRAGVTKKTDDKIFQLLSPADLYGKVAAVVCDRFSFRMIMRMLPWTYPAEIRKLIPSGSHVLDVGCGDGYLMEWINCRGEYKVFGVDINKVDLDIAKKRVVKINKSVYQNLLALDLSKELTFRRKFDVVLCSQVVEHLEKKKALELVRKIEKLAEKRVIVATINGFFQFNSRKAGKYDVHRSGWSPRDFQSMGYKVQGQGLKIIYEPGKLKDRSPVFLHPALFLVSYLMTPVLRFFYPAALLLIAHKDIDKLQFQ